MKLRKNKRLTEKNDITLDWDMAAEKILYLDLTENSQILDIGSKDGKKANYVINKGQLIMSDISKELYSNTAPFVLSDATTLPYKDNSFDLVTIFHVLEHLKNANAALKEIHRVLKKKGTVLIVTPNVNRFTFIFSYALRIISSSHTYPLNPDHVFEYSSSDIENMMKNSRFKFYKIEPIFMGISRILRLRRHCDQWLIVARK